MAPTDKKKADAPVDASNEGLPASVATPEQNAALKHTDENAPATTRDDLLDAGVPMTQGDPEEPIGPEDALAGEPTRGDYSGRIDAGPHLASVPTTPEERKGTELKDEDGNVVGYEPGPSAKLVEQVPSSPSR